MIEFEYVFCVNFIFNWYQLYISLFLTTSQIFLSGGSRTLEARVGTRYIYLGSPGSSPLKNPQHCRRKRDYIMPSEYPTIWFTIPKLPQEFLITPTKRPRCPLLKQSPPITTYKIFMVEKDLDLYTYFYAIVGDEILREVEIWWIYICM